MIKGSTLSTVQMDFVDMKGNKIEITIAPVLNSGSVTGFSLGYQAGGASGEIELSIADMDQFIYIISSVVSDNS